MAKIDMAGECDLGDLLPLMRGYCDYYAVAPSDASLLASGRALVADPECEGVQLIARADDGRARLRDGADRRRVPSCPRARDAATAGDEGVGSIAAYSPCDAD